MLAALGASYRCHGARTRMNTNATLLSAALVFLVIGTDDAAATDRGTIALDIDVDRPADVVWNKISGFCQVGAWLETSCAIITPGPEGIGAVRRLFGRLDELMIARTAYS